MSSIVALITTVLIAFFSAKALAQSEEKFHLQYNGMQESVVETTTSPAFWIPAGLALIMFTDDLGRQSSRDARQRHPFWGDRDRASAYSDRIRTWTSISMLGSSLLLSNKGAGFVASNMAFDVFTSFLALEARGVVRDGNRRTRPNGGDASFPSGHAAAAGARVSLSNYNIFSSNLSKNWQYGLVTVNWTMAYLVGYSRVESHNHYPEDVLAGIAIGYWVTQVVKKSFTNVHSNSEQKVSLFIDGNPRAPGVSIVHYF